MLEIKQLVIQIDQFTRRYNFTAQSPGISLLKGQSGCGKTSLLHSICGFITPREGDIYWHNESIIHILVEERPVALMFQQHNFFEHISVIKNIELATGPNKCIIMQHAEQLGIKSQLSKLPSELSGGQRKRAALLKTLLRAEPIVLLDEPFAQLDNENRDICRQWLKQSVSANNKTVLLVSHDEHDTLIADKIYQL